MNENALPGNPHFKPQTLSSRVTRMLRRAQDSFHSTQGTAPTHLQLAHWTGVAEGTVKYWLANKGNPTAEFLLQLLERIPPAARQEIVEGACRVLPTIEHPRVRVDATVRSRLNSLLAQPQGLTFIQGGSDEARTFLLTALGHSFLALTERPHPVLGLDAHEPDWFVPVPGVRYLGNVFSPARLAEAVQTHWPDQRSIQPRLFLLNAIWPAVPACEKEITALSSRCSVIMAGSGVIKPALLRKLSGGPLHILCVGTNPENAKNFSVTFEAGYP